MTLPKKLLKYARSHLKTGKMRDAINELKSYNEPPVAVLKVMQGVLTLLGYGVLEEFKDWKRQIKGQAHAAPVHTFSGRLCPIP
eukprot:5915151-Prymnesium_polylepis.1